MAILPLVGHIQPGTAIENITIKKNLFYFQDFVIIINDSNLNKIVAEEI